ncbi:IS5 family transposase [Streptomyces sp. NBC_00038]|uniref:IS5 family transposase n=1 Tax=Streptomyces sp. NBC_00038 TaxID=2903615 RepID=UPI0022579C9D|nr:IS5 family transposase [Streptomyces sp. NBC_00038]MCX5562809.1 IS5 family transposase [Streptomyces sp. NBC_00038]
MSPRPPAASWRDLPDEFGPWQSAYDRFRIWTAQGAFQRLMEAVIAEAAARGQVDLGLVSVDSATARAHHHAAGMALEPEQLAALEMAFEAEEKGVLRRDRSRRTDKPRATDPGAERRCVRRRHRARLRAAELGRSRGGLTSKIHLAADQRCRPLAFVLTPGQAGDSPQFVPVLERVKVRGPVGRPWARPDAVAGDKAYSSRGNGRYLRRRGIRGVILEKADQAASRKKRSSKAGRPLGHDTELYKERNTVERCINRLRNWRGIAFRFDKTSESYTAGLHLRGAMLWFRSIASHS